MVQSSRQAVAQAHSDNSPVAIPSSGAQEDNSLLLNQGQAQQVPTLGAASLPSGQRRASATQRRSKPSEPSPTGGSKIFGSKVSRKKLGKFVRSKMNSICLLSSMRLVVSWHADRRANLIFRLHQASCRVCNLEIGRSGCFHRVASQQGEESFLLPASRLARLRWKAREGERERASVSVDGQSLGFINQSIASKTRRAGELDLRAVALLGAHTKFSGRPIERTSFAC